MKKKVFHVFTAATVASSIVSPAASAAVQEDSVGKEVTFTITQLSKNTLQTSKGTFTPDATMKALFNTANKGALKGAEVTVIVKDGKIVEITELKLNTSGSAKNTLVLDGDGIVINGDLVINADYISIQNMTVNNRTVISSNAKNEVTLDSVVIKKDLIVENNEVHSLFDTPAKGEHSRWLSLDLENTNVKVVDIKRKNVTLDSDERISRVILADNISAVELNADINTVTVNVNDQLSITGYGHINTLLVDNAPFLFLNLQSTLGQVTVTDKSAKVDIGDLVSIHRLTLQPGQRVDAVIANYNTHKGKIQQLDGEKSASTAAPFINFSPDKNPTDIAWVWPITETISVGTSYTLPTTVKAILYNQTEKTVPITWQTSQISTTVIGTQTLEGTVDGYSSKIKLTLTVIEGNKKTLQALINSITYVPVSTDGKDIAKDKTWTTLAAYNALASAVSAARPISTSVSASVTDIEIAELKLNSAIEKYNAAKRPGLMVVSNKEALTKAIAGISYVAVSTDGKEVLATNKWTTQSAKDTLETAVTAAQAVASRFDATQADIDAALATLNAAIGVYNAAQKSGLKVTVDTAALKAEIEKVAYVEVSEDGKDIAPTLKWTTQAVKDTLKTAADKAQAVLDKEDATQAEVTAATSTLKSAIDTYIRAQKDGLQTVDKTALKAEIAKIAYVKVSTDGKELEASVKWTTAEAKKVLEAAETAAKAMYANSKATAVEVAAAVSTLNQAITTYTAAQKDGTKPVPVTKTALETAIAGVEYVKVSATDGKELLATEKWTSAEDFATIKAAVKVAQDVVDKLDATQVEVDEALTVLQAAITAYKIAQRPGLIVDFDGLKKAIEDANAAKVGIKISADGTDISTTDKWTTTAELGALQTAVNEAVALEKKTDATQAEVDKEIIDLTKAIDTYVKAKKDGKIDFTALTDKITEADTAFTDSSVSISVDGKELTPNAKWTTQSAKDKLEDAITAAKVVKSKVGVKQSEINDAADTLTTALTAYGASIQTVTVNKTNLEKAITSVTYVVVSEDGKNVSPTLKWVKAGYKAALDDAVNIARTVKDKPDATQNEVEDALKDLTDVIQAHTADGTQTPPTESYIDATTELDLTSASAVDIKFATNSVVRATIAQVAFEDPVVITFDNTITKEGKEIEFDVSPLKPAFTFTIGVTQYTVTVTVTEQPTDTWTITETPAPAGKKSTKLRSKK